MDTDPTVETQLLAHAKKQTEALESLRGIALMWTAVGVIAVIAWIGLVLHS